MKEKYKPATELEEELRKLCLAHRNRLNFYKCFVNYI